MKILYTALLAVASVFSVNSIGQNLTIEQTNHNGDNSLANFYDVVNSMSIFQELGQTFTSTYPMQLQTVQFDVNYLGQTGNVIVEIYSCNSINEFTTLIGSTSPHAVQLGWNVVDLSPLNIQLQQGRIYGYRLRPQGGLNAYVRSNSPKSYFGGSSFSESGQNRIPLPDDLTFRVTGQMLTQGAFNQPLTGGATLGLLNRYDHGTGSTRYREAGVTFTNNAGGILSRVSFHVAAVNDPGEVNITVYESSNLVSFPTVLGSRSVSVASSGWQNVDLYDLNIALSPGSNYGFVIRSSAEFSGSLSTVAAYLPNSHTYEYVSGFASGNGSFMHTTIDLSLVASVYSILPVKFGPFTAQEVSGAIALKWETLSERQSKAFHIQHSTDGRNWKVIGTVAAIGHSDIVSKYHFTHRDAPVGKNYYRLFQEDMDGKGNLSKIVTASIVHQKPVIRILENPVQGKVIRIEVLMKEGAPLKAILSDAQGRIVQSTTLHEGYNALPVTASTGVYFLRVGGQTFRIKL